MQAKKEELLKKNHVWFEEDHLSHAYLIESLDEDRSYTIARLLTERILFDFGDLGDASKQDQAYENLVLIDEEKIGIDTLRQASNAMFTRPIHNKYKVILIKNADIMRVEAQNALLKSLEEPPAYIVWILTSKRSSKLLPTIQSRCQIIRLGQGDTKKEEAIANEDEIIYMVEAALQADYLTIMTHRKFYDKQAEQKDQTFAYLLSYLQDLLHYLLGKEVTNKEWVESFQRIYDKININQVVEAIKLTEESRQLLDVNINFPIALEHVFLAIGKGRGQ